jgi:diaminopimelate decarboxylase
MRDAVREAIDQCERATLVFDIATIAANMFAVAKVARGARMTALFAMKSFPHPTVIELARRTLAGFDAASVEELHAAVATPSRQIERGHVVSIADPSGRAIAHAPADGHELRRVIVACESVEQVRAAPVHADIALRVSASVTGRDPAVGAILDGTGHRRSRFGVTTAGELRALREAAGERRVGLHVHHGPVTATSAERFIASAKAAIDLARSAGLEPAFIDLGGAWHGIGIAKIDEAFAQIRAGIDDVMIATAGDDRVEARSIDILVEPGRLLVEGAGFAVGPITSVRDLGDGRVLVTSGLSRICHLRWSQVELVAKAPHPGMGVKAIVVGPTCYEEDVVGEWIVEVGEVEKRVVVRNVSGYAVAWNKGFGGVPEADVVFVD